LYGMKKISCEINKNKLNCAEIQFRNVVELLMNVWCRNYGWEGENLSLFNNYSHIFLPLLSLPSH
jgi:hypothetical protein